LRREADCNSYSAFRDITNTTDMDAPYEYAGMSFSEKASKATARRLRRGRQHLGIYRHDLLVATRVVNNIEREMVKAEWENWLTDENSRCKQVQMMLEGSRINDTNASEGEEVSTEMQQVFNARARKVENLRRWQEEYCGSCRKDQEVVLAERKTRL